MSQFPWLWICTPGTFSLKCAVLQKHSLFILVRVCSSPSLTPSLSVPPRNFAHPSRDPPDVFDMRWAKEKRHVVLLRMSSWLCHTTSFTHKRITFPPLCPLTLHSLNRTTHPNHWLTELLLLRSKQTATSGRTYLQTHSHGNTTFM